MSVQSLWPRVAEGLAIRLGASFAAPASSDAGDTEVDAYVTARYEFQPGSADRTQPGRIKLDDKTSQRVEMRFAHRDGASGGDVVFVGSWCSCGETECVLVLDDTSDPPQLVLERVSGRFQNLRHERRQLSGRTAVPGRGAARAATSAKLPQSSRATGASVLRESVPKTVARAGAKAAAAQRKPCKCGSITHARTSYKGCPLNAKTRGSGAASGRAASSSAGGAAPPTRRCKCGSSTHFSKSSRDCPHNSINCTLALVKPGEKRKREAEGVEAVDGAGVAPT